jgi:uncharacterized protein (TIGR02246 family)
MHTSHEELQLRKLFGNTIMAWNQGDGPLFASYFTKEADYVTFAGEHLLGRQAIAEAHQALFTGILKGSQLLGEVKDIRFLSPEVAVMHGVGMVKLRWQRKPSSNRQSINTQVAVKQLGEWKIAAFHNCRIQPPGLLQKWMKFWAKPRLF